LSYKQSAAGVDDEDESGLTPLHTAAELGLTAMAELLLDKGADLNHAGGGWLAGAAAAAAERASIQDWHVHVHVHVHAGLAGEAAAAVVAAASASKQQGGLS
jgi:ankyrin repeat protein